MVVATRRRPEALAEGLTGLRGSIAGSLEVIVVDNSDGDESTREVAAAAGARYLHEPCGGLSRARTVGARAATGEFVAFIDDDAVPEAGWLGRHRSAYDDPAVAATTGAILPMGRPDGKRNGFTSGQWSSQVGVKLDRHSPSWFERANFGGIGNGGNMTFRRSLFEAGWGFHEDLGLPQPMGGEENFAFHELIHAGWRVAFMPGACVFHPEVIDDRILADLGRRNLRSALTYAAFLLAEARGYRRQLVGYLVGSARGAARWWRLEAGPPLPTVPLLERVWAASLAPLMYARRRLSCRGRLPRRSPPAGPLGGAGRKSACK